MVPELLLPAGSFDSALAAIEGGADALYFGFSEFSARKQARNFDSLEYRRLLRHARDRGIRLYATINTILAEKDLPRVSSLLAFLGRFPPDAVIVQDWGLATLMRARYPGIAIHASTQTAVQGERAARLAAELGASRIVLPRETPLDAMRRIKAAFPEIEYEVFVHGALCYSFSGLCLASGMLLGRSGNRGECAQVCRSYYDANADAGRPRGKGYWFSCRDLCLAERVAEIAAAGMSSLKIEGRMKSPEYCYAVARLYRASLDGFSKEEIHARLEAARTTFARESTEGWLVERGGARLIDAAFPGHRGSRVGRFKSSSDGRVLLELSSSLGLRDGLLAFEGRNSERPIQFSVAELRDHRTGRLIAAAKAGDIVELSCPGRPLPGSEARRISDRRQDRKAASPEEFPPAVLEIPLRLMLAHGADGAQLGAEIALPRFDGEEGQGRAAAIGLGEPFAAQQACTPGGFLKALSIFAEGGDADFRLVPEGDLSALADLFIPPSVLKREKNRIYKAAEKLIEEAQEEYARTSLVVAANASLPDAASRLTAAMDRYDGPLFAAPPRSALVFAYKGLPSGMPFATPRLLREGAELPRSGEAVWLPLMPLVADLSSYEKLVEHHVRAEIAKGERVMVGLGGLHHIAFARKLADELSSEGEDFAARLAFFLDVHCYIANRLALTTFDALLPRIAFAYSYLEAEADPSIARLPGIPPIVPVGERFEPPLFLSAGCLKKHHAEDGACPAACDRRWSAHLEDRDRGYIALVEDCVSMLFRIPSKG
jgi:putative protease